MRPRPRSSRRWRAISIASIIRTFTPLPFLQGDAKAMEQQVAWAAGKLGKEDLLLSLQSDTEAYAGHAEKARGLSPPRGGGRETLRSERACGGLGSQRGPAGSAVWQRCARPPGLRRAPQLRQRPV